MSGALVIGLMVLLIAALGLVMADLHRRARRTLVVTVPGGLRFESQRLTVQVQRKQQELRVTCRQGVLTPAPGGATEQGVPAGPVAHTFAAVGIAVTVRNGLQPEEGATDAGRAGPFDIVFRGADGTELRMARVNAPVAASFKLFYLQVRHWIDKLEQRLERERIERLRADEEATQARQHAELMARLMGEQPADATRTAAVCEALAAAQIASWRQAAGFLGQHSTHQTDASGQVLWFVDLAMDGRITLYANQRSIHSTLHGATVEAKGGGLELAVRDAHWSEDNAELSRFLVLKGCSAEERRAWKERLEILCRSLAH